MGCMVFGSSKWEGSPRTLDEEEGLELLKKAYDMGINTWTYSRSIVSTVKHHQTRLCERYMRWLYLAKYGTFGASSMWAWEFGRLQHIAEMKDWAKFTSMQNFYNLVYREEEREMIPFCKATGVGVIPWSPLARGLLTQPWGTGESQRAKGDRFAKIWNATVSSEVVNRVEQPANKKGVSMAVLSTAWMLHKGCWPIMGLNNGARIEETIGALKVKLSDDEVTFLEEEYKPREV
ncbi:Fc.00g029730.m01.CDS01 [Cosmosporella sp. VM-42]